MSDGGKVPKADGDGESVDMSRRKLLYIAPVVMSQRLFNSTAGCGKVDPITQACTLVSFNS